MNTPAKRLVLPLAGVLVSGGLIAAGPAAAQAEPTLTPEKLVTSAPQAYSIAKFWLDANGAALKKAKEYDWDAKEVTKLVTRGQNGLPDDGKAGLIAPTGSKKGSTAKIKNINLPLTIGKVFFVDSKGAYRWCSASSVQARHRNLVATAAHCVYDVDGNKDVMDKWVFIPGYFQGKAVNGLYVGVTAYAPYDMVNFEDFDSDYAFVSVTDGISLASSKEVSFEEYNAWKGAKWVRPVEIDKKTYEKCVLDLGPCWTDGKDTPDDLVGPDYPGAVLDKREVSKEEYDKAKVGKGQGNKYGEPVTEPVTETEYKAYKGPGTKSVDKYGNHFVTRYYVQKWLKPGTVKKYYKDTYRVVLAKDHGRLGDVVGGQGLAWNQPVGQQVYAFGYPGDRHPDGNKAFTGLTPKYCAGRTLKKAVTATAFKVAEHVALKCSMTGGADGGPLIMKYDNAKRTGYINGVISLFHDQDGNDRVDHISTPYFNGDTGTLYNTAQGALNVKIVSPKGELLK
ncbi:hypothetical protein [Spongiactinospora sp. TRM90649]|uniref:trypsin-like serine peptidase n=1 Tax=Spongiactinospora sp. TRM90649 TaxID=3031114 RepID=UPI0023F61A55|nr:hypothetical protein [Spongiactinospora sp. TRM90649]MDF5756478.1 hypothetical protein [Spongiactinospora sp. TRM90649]